VNTEQDQFKTMAASFGDGDNKILTVGGGGGEAYMIFGAGSVLRQNYVYRTGTK
jgi:hypothetical protein